MTDNQTIEDVAFSIRKAMRGIGADEKKLIKSILSISKSQRQEVKEFYQRKFNKNLEEKLKSEFSGYFLKATLYLMMPTDDFEATFLHDAIKCSNNIIFNDDDAIIQLLCTKTSDEIKILNKTYKKLFGIDLDSDLENITSNLGRMLRILANDSTRDKSVNLDERLAKKDALELYEAGRKQTIANENVFINVFCYRSFKQLSLTFEYYYQIASTSIQTNIEQEVQGKLKNALLAIIQAHKSLPRYFAEQLYISMKGIGTNNDDLQRILIWRSEIDLSEIKFEYQAMYGRSLYDDVKSELNGNYKRLLLALIGSY